MGASNEGCLNRRYQLEELLGAGGFGAVYRARDLVLGRRVAIKLLRPAAVGRNALARFLREARIVARLAHPNIVSLYDIDLADLAPFLVMEYVPGVDVRRLAMGTRTPLPLHDVHQIASQGLAALQYAHEQGVLHRDLKPENVLVTCEPSGSVAQVKLTDFGLATAMGLSAITRTGYVAGTSGYVAPERALGRPADHRADLYSFGVILYELIAGCPPFSADTPDAILYQHVHELPPPIRRFRPDISPDLEALVLQLLAKDPAERPAGAGDVRSAIEAWWRRSRDSLTSAAPAQPGQAPAIRCGSCGAANSTRSRFCTSCGSVLPRTATRPSRLSTQAPAPAPASTSSRLHSRTSLQPREGVSTVLARLART